MKSEAFQYIDRRTFASILFLIFIQQCLIALGTFALAKAGFSINSHFHFVMWVCVSLATHLASPFLTVFIKPLESRITFLAYRKFLNRKLLSKAGNPNIWQHKNQKEKFLASIGVDADGYLGATIFVGLDVFSYVLSILFGVAVIGFVLDAFFIPAFILSSIPSFIAYRIFREKVQLRYQDEQISKTALASYLLNSWDNLFFRNKSTISRYQTKLDDKFEVAQRKSYSSAGWAEALIFILSLASSLPVIVALCWYLVRHPQSPESLVALLATIPRQLNLLTTFRNIFQNLTAFLGFETKFKSLSDNSDLIDHSLHDKIRADEILINGVNHQDLDAILEAIRFAPRGRLEVRGNNGTGKSTLLLYLNQKMDSHYLPSHPNFDLSEDARVRSTGQHQLNHIYQLADVEEQFLLLDEWDANLDDGNIDKGNDFLNKLSETKTIIEVRHRK